MKTHYFYSVHKVIAIIFFFTLCNSYSQEKTLFGVPITDVITNPKNGIIRCASTEYEKFIQKNNPKRMTNTEFETWLSPLITKYKTAQANSKTKATIIKIPVVIHIAHSGQAIGTAPNITDAQAESQITVLNQDFRRMLNTPGYNTNPIGADIEIEFILAKQDPNGNPTNGIDRVNFLQTTWSDNDIETILKPATIWDPTLYLNMWTLQFANITLLGYAQFPDASGLAGLTPSGGNANTDGVVSRYDAFGSNDFGSSFLLLPSLYNKGRTMTHEVGHWLGLLHIWGNGGSRNDDTKICTASDYCADTPQAGWENYECDPTYDSCPTSPGNDMIENYMDYTNDECMNIFTQNQKDRIMVIMNNATRRSSLKTSTKATAIALFTNDAEVKISTYNSGIVYGCTPPSPINKQVSIYNRGTSTLTSATLNYSINGGANKTHTWSGTLAQNQSADITLPNTNINGVLNVSLASANGGIDQRSSNNAASRNFFDIFTSAENYNYTNYVFRLQKDLWGSEITWSLNNESGTTLYSGGPYDDTNSLPALLTENWTLANNQCYTFTINDSEGDGICCDGGNGYYDIKTNNGAITVKSGKEYGYSDTKSLTTNSLGTTEFETSSDIYLYPNPAQETLYVLVPNNFGLPNSYTISNVLGQKMSQKNISKEADLTINTSSLSNGVYFITIQKDNQKRTLRFIKE